MNMSREIYKEFLIDLMQFSISLLKRNKKKQTIVGTFYSYLREAILTTLFYVKSAGKISELSKNIKYSRILFL